jgi:hypothetical protein
MKWNKAVVRSTILLVAGLALLAPLGAMGQNFSPQPLPGGVYFAAQYNYGGAGNGTANITPNAFKVTSAPIPAGAGTVTISYGSMFVNGRKLMPFSVSAPILIGGNANQETVTPTAVSCSTPDITGTCNITATFAQAHGAGDPVASGTAGLQEAINDAFVSGGGVVRVDQSWTQAGGTEAFINAALVYASVAIEDYRAGQPQYYNPGQTASTFLAVPATLTAVTALPSATPVGAYGTGTYHLCIAYVDVMGNEGACSLDFSEAGLATGSFIFTAPAASTGAVGYTIYISLTGGTYALSYQVPLTSSVCTLTKIETITPACAVANTTYGQSGATATVTAITVNTSPLALQLGTASTTADYVGNSNGRTTYGYVAGSHVGIPGLTASSLTFTAGPATVATTVPQVIGTLTIPPSFLNRVGRTIRVCGKEKMTGASATIEQVQFWWDGAGSNAAGVPVNIGNLQAAAGPNTAAVYNGNFCFTFHTTVAGAGVTAGSILGDNSSFIYYLASAPVGSIFTGGDTFTAATGSLNLAGLYSAGFTTRLHIVQLHTTGTDVSPQLLNVTVEALD